MCPNLGNNDARVPHSSTRCHYIYSSHGIHLSILNCLFYSGSWGYLKFKYIFKKCLVTLCLTLTHSIPNVYGSSFEIKHMTGYIGLIEKKTKNITSPLDYLHIGHSLAPHQYVFPTPRQCFLTVKKSWFLY